MTVSIFQIDAFTDRPFAGNPAAVCLLPGPGANAWMQAIAAEMNLSETAFVWRDGDIWQLQWFTPTQEVELCGHATLAAATALWAAEWLPDAEPAVFQTRSGRLQATRGDQGVELDFPATPPEPAAAPSGLLEALDVTPVWIGRSRFDVLVAVETERAVRSLAPDFRALSNVDARGILVTGPSDSQPFDFVSRFFAPASGIDEDPVTGSAHCCLAPYWGERLQKRRMVGYQASARGGVVDTELRGDRVVLRGDAVIVFRGELSAKANAIPEVRPAPHRAHR